MKRLSITASITAMVLASAFPALAEGDLSRADPTEIILEMGSTDDPVKPMYFEPNHLDLETGKAYKIVLKNVDDEKHEFAGPELIAKVFTRKVEIATESGDLVAEIKGNINEIEVGPGQEVEWFIVPIQTGEDIEMVCELEGHKEAGMVGTVTIH
jgi:uncharacterized cupredoxin-like copper-binding protein